MTITEITKKIKIKQTKVTVWFNTNEEMAFFKNICEM